MKGQVNHHGQQGFALIDVLAAITIFALLVPGIIVFLQMTSQSTNSNVAATHMKRVAFAAGEYIQDNHSSIVSSATNSTSVKFTLTDLRSGGYLLSGYNNVNPWGQTYSIYAFNPEDQDVHLVILTSGGRGGGSSEFENTVVPATAAMMGANGGYVPTGEVPSENTNTLQGAYGGWSFGISGTDVTNPGSGHLAYSRYMDEEQFGNDYLYRDAVPGHPEVNRMTTELDMNGNTILMGGNGSVGGSDGEGVGIVNFEDSDNATVTCAPGDDYGGSVFYDEAGGGLFLCKNGQKVLIADSDNGVGGGNTTITTPTERYLVSHGDIVPKPSCSSGTPEVFTSPSVFSEGADSTAIHAVQTWATDTGSDWTINLRIKGANATWVNPPADYGKVFVVAGCS